MRVDAQPRVRAVAGELPSELDALAATAGGSFFQSAAWLRAVVRAAPEYEPFVLLAETDGVTAACPLLRRRRWGTSWFYGGVWGTYGGIVSRDAPAAIAVQEALLRLARDARVLCIRVHDFAGTLADAPGWRRTAESCHVLDLPADANALWDGVFTSQNRNKIRKAEKLGVVVRRARDAAAFASYVALYRESSARWGTERALPAVFFEALAGAHPGVDVWLAEHEGEAVAALLNFTCGGQVMNWGNVSRRAAWNLSPNNLLHWRALQAACADAAGPRLYNFGSSAGLPGVETFKSAFGAREYIYRRREAGPAWVARLQQRGRTS